MSVRARVVARTLASWRLWPVLLSVATCSVGCGIVYIIAPGLVADTALGEALPTLLERIWALAYTAGGVLLLYGIARVDRWWELVGLVLLAACFLGYAYALFWLREWSATSITLPVFFSLGAGCMARACLLRYRP